MKNVERNANKVSAQAEGTLLSGAKSGAESSRKGGRSMYGRSKGKRILSLFLAILLGIGGALSGIGDLMLQGKVDEVLALDFTKTGNPDTFASGLPATEVHIDSSKLVNPEIALSSDSNYSQNNNTGRIEYVGSRTPQSILRKEGTVATFTFKDAAILSDRTTADVVITYSDPNFYFGYNMQGNNNYTNRGGALEAAALPMIGTDGRSFHVTVRDGGSTYRWYYGLEMKVNVAVPGASGEIIYGLTGMSVQRSGGNYQSIPEYVEHNAWSEQAEIYDGAVTTPIFAPQTDEASYGFSDSSLVVAGKSGHGGGDPDNYDGTTWNKSYLTGFITEGTADTGVTMTYRGGAGWNPTATTKAQAVDSNLMENRPAFKLDISSSPGGTVWINKNTGTVDASTGSGSNVDDRGQGLYSVPRGKTMTVKLKPDNNEYYPEIVYAGSYTENGRTSDTVTPTRVVEGGQVYYTYTFDNILEDKELYVKWAPIQAKVKATKDWIDESNAYQNRGDIKFNLDPAILPAQKIDISQDTYSVDWGDESGFTDVDNNTIPGTVSGATGYNASNQYYYDNNSYTWKPYSKNTNGLDSGVKEAPAAASGSALKTDFLPKYDANNTIIDYSGVNEENIGAYSIETYYDKEQETITEENNTLETPTDPIQPNAANYEYKIKNTLKTEDLTITKAWNDASNSARKRPTADEFKALLKMYWKTAGNAVPDWSEKTSDFASKLTVTDNGDDTFTVKWAGLPQYYQKQEADYQAEEGTEPADYTLSPTGKVTNGSTITNTLEKDVSIKKQWVDENNKNNNRLDASAMTGSFTLYTDAACEQAAQNAPTPEVTDNGDGTFTVTWKGVPKYDSAGNERTYYAKETTVPNAYTITQGSNGVVTDEQVANAGTIINTEKKKNITLTKTWNDAEYFTADTINKGYTRPNVKITVTGTAGSAEVFKKEYELTAANAVIGDNYKWSATFTDLPIYYGNQVITYTAEETEPDGFEKADNGAVDLSTSEENNAIMSGGATNTPKKEEKHESITLKVKKVDANTNTGTGIEGATFTVSGTPTDGSSFDDLVVTTGANGIAEFTFTKAGTYTLSETTAPTGYEKDNSTYTIEVNEQLTSITLNQANDVWTWLYNLVFGSNTTFSYDAATRTGTISNTPKTSSLEVTKTWADNNNQDGARRTTFVQLQKSVDGGATWTNVAGQTADVDTTYTAARTSVGTFSDLPAYEDGNPVKYRVSETAINNYTTTYDAGSGTEYAAEGAGVDLLDSSDATGDTTAGKSIDVKNYHKPAETKITINKKWADDKYDNPGANVDNQYKRPDSLSFTISGLVDGTAVTLPDGKTSATITPSDKTDDAQWTTTVEGLPLYSAGEIITYDVTENTPADYTMTVTQGMRRNTANNTWSIEVTNTPNEGKEYTPNSLQIKKTDVNTGNVLKGGEFKIYQENGYVLATTDMVEANTVTIGENGLADVKFLQPGTYIIRESAAPTGYQLSTTDYTVVVNEKLDKIEIKTDSSKTPSTFWNWIYELLFGNVTPSGWDSDNQILTVPNTPETTSLTVAKQWADQTNQDGKRVASLDFTLTASAAVFNNNTSLTTQKTMSGIDLAMIDNRDAGEVTFDNLPIYRDGEKVAYTVTEKTVPTGYTESYDKNNITLETNANNNRITVKNTHEVEKINIAAVKEWDDNNNQDGKRAAATAVTLYANDIPNRTVGSVTSTTESGATIQTWTGLDAYDNGQPITYRIEESSMPEYTTTYELAYKDKTSSAQTSASQTIKGDAISQAEGENTATFTITNKHVPETTKVSVAKIWADENDQDGFRSSVTGTMALYKKVGDADGTPVIGADTKTATTADDWTASWENLPVYENGTRIKYYVVETLSGDKAAEYAKSGDGEATGLNATSGDTGTITVTNTHTPEKASIKVIKNWDDKSNQDGFRPGDLTVTVVGTVPAAEAGADPVQVSTFDLTLSGSGDSWEATKADLPVYSGGKKITYTVSENIDTVNTKVDAAGSTNKYSVNYDTKSGELNANQTTELELTNFRETDTTQITIVKTWNDADIIAAEPTDGNTYTRPVLTFTIEAKAGSSAVNVFDNGTKSSTTDTLTGETNGTTATWTKTITGLQKYYNGTEITYTATEDTPDGFTKSSEGALTVTNTPLVGTDYTPVSISIKKVDAKTNSGTGLAGGTFTVYLEDGTTLATAGQNGQVDVRESTTDGAGLATFTFNEPGIYKIKETSAPDGYIASSDTYTVEVDKTLSKISYKDSDSFWEWLYKLFVGDDSTGTWDDDKQLLTVTNEPDTTSLTVNKIWHDNNNQDGLRVEEIPFELIANGAVFPKTDGTGYTDSKDKTMTGISKVMIDDNVAGTVTFDNLPMYRDGKPVKYTVLEMMDPRDGGAPDGYTDTYSYTQPITLVKDAASNRVTVTNTHTPETIDISVMKDWDDSDPSRRGNATLTLEKQVEGSTATTIVDQVPAITADTQDNATVQTWLDLPVYENGKKITYSVRETQIQGYAAPIYSTAYTKKDDSQYSGNNAVVNASDVKETATVTVTNVETLNITVKKIWVDGANANVTLQLFRTATPEADLVDSAIKKVDSVTSTAENPKKVKTWSPYASDGTTLIEGWKEVPRAIHTFVSDHFANSSTGDDETHVFEGLPKYDENGNKYLYRVLETTVRERFEADQTDNYTVTNTNVHKDNGFANINVVKELQGREWQDDDEFFFRIEAVDGKNTVSGETIAKDDVPIPRILHEGTETVRDVASAVETNTEVGALGRAVTFTPIEYTTDDVQMGQTIEYNYIVYEVADADGHKLTSKTDDKGITYVEDATSTDDSFVAKIHTLKVVVINDGGKLNTGIYWDGSSEQSAVPVYTNTYDAAAYVHAYIIKNINGRDYAGSDSFSFDVINLSGSVLRPERDDPAITEPTIDSAAATVDAAAGGVYVEADGGTDYDPSTASSGATKAVRTEKATWIKLSDLSIGSGGKAKGTFLYELIENKDNSSAEGDDLLFDGKRVYLRVVAEDNLDGTLKIEETYWLDAACKIPAPATKVLINTETGEIAEAGKTAADSGYAYANAAYFENEKVSDIVVKKIWVSTDENGQEVPVEPADNAVVRLNRYKVEDLENPGELPSNIDEWEPVETHTFDRGDYYKATINGVEYTQKDAARAIADGTVTPAQFAEAQWTLREDAPSYTFEDLPLHVVDENGKTWQYIYRVREATGSEAYTTQYKTDVANQWVDDWTGIHNARDHVITIKNKLAATNTVNIAAVKQLMGRDWLDKDADNEEVDRYTFTLEPIGIGTYYESETTVDSTTYKAGDLKNTETEEVADGYKYDGTNIVKRISDSALKQDGAGNAEPNMPAAPVSTELESTAADKALAAKKTRSNDYANDTEEVVGVGERLARFGSITYTMDDLVYNPTTGHMQGDFFYLMKEDIPTDAVMLNDDGTESDTTYAQAVAASTDAGKKFKHLGVTYDGTVHTVHVKVRENRTNELVTQIAYDEKTPGDIETGTQFTPVYTNYYGASTEVAVEVEKRILGRDWKADDNFDFVMIPMAGAPFADADASEFPEIGTQDHNDREARLEQRHAIHNHDGEHVKRLFVNPNQEIQTLTMPKIKVDLNSLTSTASGEETGENAVKDSKGNVVPAGMKYGRFMYALEETDEFDDKNENSVEDLVKDPDTEYARVTVIDNGDGTLDSYVEIFEDRYASESKQRKDPETGENATIATFVNKIRRDLEIEKAWTAPASSDITLELQWTTKENPSENDWTPVAGTEWITGVNASQNITVYDYNHDDNARTFSNLPAYMPALADGSFGYDDLELNDKWVYYRVVETTTGHFDTRYSDVAYAANDTVDTMISDGSGGEVAKYSEEPLHTGPEKDASGAWITPENRVTKLYVTNFPEDLEGPATPHVVKQLIGRGWTSSDTFTFVIEQKESKLGDEDEFTPYDPDDEDRIFPMPSKTEGEGASAVTAETNTATATMQSSEPVSVNEYNAAFDPITIKLSNLKVDPADNVAKGWFTYTITEKIPDGADSYTEGEGNNAKTYYVKDNIKYTTETHTVTIYAQNDGNGAVTTSVSYDGRPVGDFVPVYTNEALLETPIRGTKTWVGGEDSEHVNATAAGDEGTDKLGIKIYRKTVADKEVELTKDDAGRDLKVVWSAATGNATYTIKAVKTTTTVDPETSEETTTTELVNPVFDTVGPKGNEYVYRIEESASLENYEPSYRTIKVSDDTITNTSTKKDSIKVTKTWDDSQNAAGFRPDKVTVHLYKEITKTDGTETVQVEVGHRTISYNSEDDQDEHHWTTGTTWDNLPVYDEDGNKIKYVIIEESEAGYTTTYALDSTADADYKVVDGGSKEFELDGSNPDAPQTIDVKNSLTPATNEVKVTKVWGDDSNLEGKRPESVTFKLSKYVWDSTLNSGKGAYSTTKTPVSGTSGSDIKDLVLDGTKDTTTDPHANELEPTDSNTWVGKWTDLPLEENGKAIIYVVEEVVDGTDGNTGVYATAGTAGKYSNTPCISGDQVKGFTVKNTYTEDLTSASITKVWEDDSNETGMRPDTLTMELWRTYKDGSSVEGVDKFEKVETDANGNTIKHVISADDASSSDSNKWEYSVSNLPKNIFVTVDEGADAKQVSRPITYYWKETVPQNYRATASGDAPTGDADTAKTSDAGASTVVQKAANGETVTNKLEVLEPLVIKHWADGNNTKGIRPEPLKTKMYLYETTSENPENASDSEWTLIANAEVEDNDGLDGRVSINEWRAGSSITGDRLDINNTLYLPAYKDGKLVTYRLKEVITDEAAKQNYTVTYMRGDAAVTDLLFDFESKSGSIEFLTVTNSLNPDFTITKKWVDNGEADGPRPSADAYKENLKLFATGPFGTGGAAETKDVTSDYADKLNVTDNDDNTYTVTWEGLPQYAAGEEPDGWGGNRIIYHVVESKVSGYADPAYSNVDDPTTDEYFDYIIDGEEDESTVTDKAYANGTITNTQLINIDVKKIWDDNNNHDGQRPTSVEITLYQNGIELPSEQAAISGDAAQTLTVGTAKNETSGGTYSQSADGNTDTWTKVWINLPYADANGVPYNYTATETLIGGNLNDPNYEAQDNKSIRQILLSTWNDTKNALVFDVTNKDSEDKISFTVTKVWDDGRDVDELRPTAISYKLYQQAEGETEKTQLTELPEEAYITAADGSTIGWTENSDELSILSAPDSTSCNTKVITFNNMPRYAVVSGKGGKKITYTVEEVTPINGVTTGTDVVDSYTASVTGSSDTGITVTNTHKPVTATVTPTANKAIVGRTFEDGDEFKFIITPKDGAPRPVADYVTIKPTAGEDTYRITLPAITITGADINNAGTAAIKMADIANSSDSEDVFEYTVTEVDGGKTIDDLLYDASELTLKIKVKSADGGKTITADYEWVDNKNTFTNSYGADTNLTIRKVWVDTDADSTVIVTRPEEVTVTLNAEAGTEMTTLVDDKGFTKDDVNSTADKFIYTKDFTLTSGDATSAEHTWQVKTGVLPRYDANGSAIKYTVSEETVPNYKDPTYVTVGPLYTVVNVYKTTNFTGTKTWIDGGKSHDNTTEIKLTVERTIEPVTDDSTWEEVSSAHVDWTGNSFKIIGIPEKDTDGNVYVYRVTEKSLGGDYKTTYKNVDNDATTGFNESEKTDALYTGGTITNKLEATAELTGTKTWVGGEDSEHANSDLGLTLYRESTTNGGSVNREAIEGAVITGSFSAESGDAEYKFGTYDADEQKFTAGKYDKYDSEGYEYIYTVGAETGYDEENYTPSYDGLNVTNTFKAYNVSSVTDQIDITKVLEVATGDTRELGGEEFTFTMTCLDDASSMSATGTNKKDGTVTMTAITFENAGKYTFEITEDSGRLRDITYDETKYTVEAKVKDSDGDGVLDVTWTLVKKDGASTSETSMTFTNKYSASDDTTSITGTKVWLDGGLYHNNSVELADAFTVERATNIDAPDAEWEEVPSSDYHVDWSDGDNTFTISGLTKYADAKTSPKTEYVYRVKEAAIGAYKVTYNNGSSSLNNAMYDGGRIINTGEVRDITATKVWSGDDDHKTDRSEVTFTLYQTIDGAKKKVALDGVTNPVVGIASGTNNESNMTATWTGVPKYAADGTTEIEYSVEETNTPKNYTATITGNMDSGFTVTNVHSGGTNEFTVRKVWDDNNNQDFKRPSSVTVQLYQNGAAMTDSDKTQELSESNNWTYRFDRLPQADSTGNDYTYSVREISDGEPLEEGGETSEGYTVSYTTSTSGATITNSYTPETVSVEATKVWDEASEPDTSLRTDVKLHLYGSLDGRIVYDGGTKTITMDSEGEPTGTAEWTDLPKHCYDATPLEWTVTEDAVFGYTSNVSEASDSTEEAVKFEVTNTYVGPVSTIKVTKDWQDDNNRDNKRPTEITYELYKKVGNAEKVLVDSQIVTASDAWEYTWGDLPVVEQVTDQETGEVTEEAILYSVKEKALDSALGYDDPIVEAVEPGEFKVINGRAIDTTNLYVKKVWADNDDMDGIRPDHITILLYADGSEVDSMVITAENDWKGTFKNVPKNKAGSQGEAITYTVYDTYTENGYTAQSTNSTESGAGTEEDRLIVTNSRTSSDKIALKVTKVWAGDSDDTSGRKEVALHLMKVVEGYGPVKVEGQTKYIAADATGSDLTVTWNGLAAVETGKPVTYTVEEDAVDGYTTEISDGTFDEATNTITITVTNTKIPVVDPEKITITYDYNDGTGKKESETIERGSDEPGQPADPTRENYIFGGWERITDENGNVTYKAKWIPEEGKQTITISYEVDGVSVQENTIIKGDNEPQQPENPSKSGYVFGGWTRSVDDSGNVKYTANWVEKTTDVITETSYKVTYVDPKAASGSMILKATKYDTADLADAEADSRADSPADPSHTGWTFTGWAANKDEFGDWILVAKYNEPTPSVVTETKTVTYIDPQASNMVIKQVETDDPSTAEPPETNPSHSNMQFMGWQLYRDPSGNWIYVAQYQSDCGNVPPTPVKTHWVQYVDSDGTVYLEKVEIEPGESEPASPADPVKEGYTFGGWTRVMDQDGNVTYTARWIKNSTPSEPESTHWVQYVDSDGRAYTQRISIKDGESEPAPPADPTKDGYTFNGWTRTVDGDGNVTYTASWVENSKPDDPTPVGPDDPVEKTHWVTYVDSDGNTIYLPKVVVKDGEAEPEPPVIPTKDGYTFNGWIRTVDEDGNVTYTTNWAENPKPVDPDPEKPDDPTPVKPTDTKWITYVDGDGNIIYLPKITIRDGEAEPTPPADPIKDGYIFDGWTREVDDEGNVTYTANWKPTSNTTPSSTPSKSSSNVPKTGDASDVVLWIGLMACSAAVAFYMKRRSMKHSAARRSVQDGKNDTAA